MLDTSPVEEDGRRMCRSSDTLAQLAACTCLEKRVSTEPPSHLRAEVEDLHALETVLTWIGRAQHYAHDTDGDIRFGRNGVRFTRG